MVLPGAKMSVIAVLCFSVLICGIGAAPLELSADDSIQDSILTRKNDKTYRFLELLKRVLHEERSEVLTERGSDSGDNSGLYPQSEPAEEGNTNENLFESDLVLTKEQKQQIEASIIDGTSNNPVQKRKFRKIAKKWPGAKVYFEPFSVPATDKWRGAIEAGMRHMEELTCIRFFQRSWGDRINFTRGAGCWSYFGVVFAGMPQPVNIGTGCTSRGTIVHEIMHALGMFHEQSRPDRDNYVTIKWKNIKSGKKHNFQKYRWDDADLAGLAYDVTSVMHYGLKAFAKDRRYDTITPRDSSKRHLVGQRDGLSSADVQLVKRIYCNDKLAACQGPNAPTFAWYPNDRNKYFECVWGKKMLRPCAPGTCVPQGYKGWDNPCTITKNC